MEPAFKYIEILDSMEMFSTCSLSMMPTKGCHGGPATHNYMRVDFTINMLCFQFGRSFDNYTITNWWFWLFGSFGLVFQFEKHLCCQI